MNRKKPIDGVPQHVSHRKIAATLGLSVRALRRQIERGVFPLPDLVVGAQLLYRLDHFTEWTKTGRWPVSRAFQGGAAGRPRG